MANSSPRIDFPIQFQKTGTHYLWARAKGATFDDDSFHFGLNGTVLSTANGVSGYQGSDYVWERIVVGGDIPTLDLNAVGTQTLSIWIREDGIQLDKLLLTDSATFTPTGEGPAESPRADNNPPDPPADPTTILDNGENGSTTIGNWSVANDQGRDDDVHFIASGDGSSKATWTITDLDPGVYEIATTWSAQSNRGTDAPYSIFVGSVPVVSIDVNQQLAPDDFTDDGSSWERLTTSLAVTGTSVTVELTNDADSFVIADAVRVERTGDLPQLPEIEVSNNGDVLVDGVSSIGFGSTSVGNPLTQTVTIRNVGGADLTLQPLTVPDGFLVTQNVAAGAVLAVNESTNVQVQLTATEAGQDSGNLSFANTDADENPFDIALTGQVNNTVTAATIDDGDPEFSTIGDWGTADNQGYLDDVHFSAAGVGNDVASWSFTGIDPGQYRFATTWSAQENRATDAPYAVNVDGSTLATILVNQQETPADFEFGGAMWHYLGNTFNVANGNATIHLSDNANFFVIADGVRAIRVGDIPGGPEIQVEYAGADVVDDVSLVDLGSTAVGTPKQATFTVRNVGTADLTVQPVSAPAGFRVVSNVAANTVLAPDASTTFTLQLDAAAEGVSTGNVTFANDDSDENPFRFGITGNVISSNEAIIIDDGDVGYSTDGDWLIANDQGFNGDVQFIAGGVGQNSASWTFTNLANGIYVPAVTWTAISNRAPDARYSIFDGNTLVASAILNQELPPDDFNDNGAAWENLSAGVAVTTGSLTIELRDEANQFVIADAARVQKTGDLAPEAEIQVFDAETSLVDDVSTVDFGRTSLGSNLQKEFTVRNIGGSDLVLQPVSAPAGFGIVSNIAANTVLSMNEETTFTIELLADSVGTPSGTLSFANNDGDENPFNFDLTGEVTQTLIVDNGDPDFATNGNWLIANDQGFEADVHFIAAGTGQNTATWTFANLAAGDFRVSVTYSPQGNRATDASFRLLDQATLLQTAVINQELAPNDFSDLGAFWEDLATVTVNSGTLIVELSNNADEFVIADAVRVERIGAPAQALDVHPTVQPWQPFELIRRLSIDADPQAGAFEVAFVDRNANAVIDNSEVAHIVSAGEDVLVAAELPGALLEVARYAISAAPKSEHEVGSSDDAGENRIASDALSSDEDKATQERPPRVAPTLESLPAEVHSQRSPSSVEFVNDVIAATEEAIDTAFSSISVWDFVDDVISG